MTFLLPLGLLGLLLLPIIVLLHLIRQRRERQRVPSLQIWRDLQRQTIQQKPRRIPLTLLLLLHLLLTLLLAFALSQPLLLALRGQATHTAIILDTSTSMAATDEQPDRLSAAKAEALQLLGDLSSSDSAALIELSATPRILGQANGSDTALVLRELNQLRAGGPDGDLRQALNLAQATGRAQAALRIVILSDQALQAVTPAPVLGDVEWRVFGEAGDNVAIVAFATRPLRNGQQQLYARVANLGSSPIARTLRLDLDGTRAATEPMRLAPGGEAEWSWPLPQGTNQAVASLSGTDLQPLDDQATAVVGGGQRTKVVLVTPTTTPLERALRAQPNVEVQIISAATYQEPTDADLVVFNTYVPTSMPQTPVLVVAPPRDQQLIEITENVDNVTANTVTEERFRAIDWQPVTFDRVANVVTPPWARTIVAADDVPLVLAGQLDGQPIVIWTFDPTASNVANRLAFPLLTAATTRMLLPRTNAQLQVGEAAPFSLQHPDRTLIAAGERITRPGIYTSPDNVPIAVSALDAAEANLQARQQPDILTVARPVIEDDTPIGRELWRPFVIAGLAVLLFEWLYTNRAGLRGRFRAARKQPSQA